MRIIYLAFFWYRFAKLGIRFFRSLTNLPNFFLFFFKYIEALLLKCK